MEEEAERENHLYTSTGSGRSCSSNTKSLSARKRKRENTKKFSIKIQKSCFLSSLPHSLLLLTHSVCFPSPHPLRSASHKAGVHSRARTHSLSPPTLHSLLLLRFLLSHFPIAPSSFSAPPPPPRCNTFLPAREVSVPVSAAAGQVVSRQIKYG